MFVNACLILQGIAIILLAVGNVRLQDRVTVLEQARDYSTVLSASSNIRQADDSADEHAVEADSVDESVSSMGTISILSFPGGDVIRKY